MRVEHALRNLLVLPEGAGLPEHGVDERRLPVIDVGDDRDVAQVVSAGEWLVARHGGQPTETVAGDRGLV
jgi:hypothetical protein